MAAADRCQQCGWKPTEPGNAVCGDCAIGILKTTCPHPWGSELILVRAANGYQHPRRRCRRCYATIAHPKLRDIDPVEVETEIHNTPNESCAHCGRTDAVERHHWAPWHLFADPDKWPTSPLCPDCHRLWHRVTGTDHPRTEG